MKIAIVDKQPAHVDYIKYLKLEEYADCIDILHLSSIKKAKILKADVDLEMNVDDYDYIILIGSEACKHIAKIGSVTNYAGLLVEEKFIPMINPAMLAFKPDAVDSFDKAAGKCRMHISGNSPALQAQNFTHTEDEEIARDLLLECLNSDAPVVAFDTETSALYPRDGYLLGISLSYKVQQGVYISADCLSDELVAILQEIMTKKIIVMHNAKFDIKWTEYHLGIVFNEVVHDTLLQHYVLDETQGTHGLKTLAIKYTDFGDYDSDLGEFKTSYCKSHGIKQEDFSYAFIPFDIIGRYAGIDTAVTLELYYKFYPIIQKSEQLSNVYHTILLPGMRFLNEMEENGVPFDLARLEKGRDEMDIEIDDLKRKLYEFPLIKQFEADQGKTFNPASTPQLRIMLFQYCGLRPTGKKTGTGADSTDATVLTELAKQHEIPGLILHIRQTSKIKNTYLDKIIPALDEDSRLRTGFNISSTTSGRLSSSGKLNMQQLPRDNKLVKGCIKAPAGYKIVSQDLGTAEMYYAAVLSGDKKLMKIFQDGGDFHSSIAHMVFKLQCDVSKVKNLYGGIRQAAKAISFGILYGSGPQKVADTVTDFNKEEALRDGTDSYEVFSKQDAIEAIKQYYDTYKVLAKWLKTSQAQIKQNGFIYSAFGRKRRLRNVFSTDQGIASGEVRSGVNFLIQSVASDINLMAAMDLHNYLKTSTIDAQIFALVHDSILALVKEEDVEEYGAVIKEITQRDRGLSIKNAPIAVDFEVGDDYSFDGFEKQFPHLMEAA